MQIGMRTKEDREVMKRGEDGMKEKKERFRNQKKMLFAKFRY